MAEPVENDTPKPYLSVVIPAYNEEERLPTTLVAVEEYLAAQEWSWEVLVVDDGSRDNTVSATEAASTSAHTKVLKNPRNMGKGASIRNGMLAARGQWRLFTDADNSTPIEEVAKLLAKTEEGYAVTIGSRALPESQIDVHQPFYREWMGRVFNLIVQIFTIRGIKDTQCGFKLFSEDAAEYVFSRQKLDGFSFDVEALMLARRGGFKIAEVPVRWINSPASRVSPINDSIRMFRDVIKIRFQKYD